VGGVGDVRPLHGDAGALGELLGPLPQRGELRDGVAAVQETDVRPLVGLALDQAELVEPAVGDRGDQVHRFGGRGARGERGQAERRGDQRRRAAAGRGGHFTAPIVIPWAKCLRTSVAMISIGTMTSIPVAAIGPQATPSGRSRVSSATGSVDASTRARKVGKRNSFQDSRKENTAATKIPGAASGVMTRHSRATWPQPSMWAASSIAYGRP